MNGVVTGLVTNVVSAAIGTLARTGRHSSAENRICAKGTMIPTSIPSATPRGTERRVKRHNSDRSTRLAKGRITRLFSICSRVGMLRWIQALLRSNIARLPALAHQARLVALPVAILGRLPLVSRILALGEREFDFRPAPAVEVDRQRHERHAL